MSSSFLRMRPAMTDLRCRGRDSSRHRARPGGLSSTALDVIAMSLAISLWLAFVLIAEFLQF